MATQITAEKMGLLRAPFTGEAVGKLPKSTCRDFSESKFKRCDKHTWVHRCEECGGAHSNAMMHLDFVGHADITDRLLSVDPEWTWEPMARDEHGTPLLDRNGNLWIRLTVLGVTRPGVGDGKSAKECIGDALRNAAMRFGVALDLWAKGDRSWAHAEDQTPEPEPARQEPTTPAAALLQEIRDLAGSRDNQLAVAAEWEAEHGHPLRDATDLGSLELLRDDLRSKS